MSHDLGIYVFTTRYVIKEQSPIVCVLHDEDGDWQFLGREGNLTEDDAMVVSLDEMIQFDRTLSEVVDLPVGKQALRTNKGEPWHVYDM
jgi:hypothetical protein